MELREMLQEVAEVSKYKLEEPAPNMFRIDVAFKMQDGTNRFQYVFVRPEFPGENERIYVTSRAGWIYEGLDYKAILDESRNCFYTTFTIFEEKMASGEFRESLAVQAAPMKKHTSSVLLSSIIWETAVMADKIEEIYFGGDNM